MIFQERDHLARDVALVEAVAGGGDAGAAPLLARFAFRLDHRRERAGEVRQLDGVSCLVGRAIRLQPGPLVVRPGVDELAAVVDGVRRPRPQRKSTLRVLDRAQRHLFERHRPPALEHGERRMEHARYDRRVQADAVQVLATTGVPLDRRALRRPTLSDDRGDLALALRIHEDQAFAAEAIEILFHHSANQHGGDACVERVAALQQHFECRGARQGVPGGDGAVRAGDGRAIGSAREDDGRANDHEYRRQHSGGEAKAQEHRCKQ